MSSPTGGEAAPALNGCFQTPRKARVNSWVPRASLPGCHVAVSMMVRQAMRVFAAAAVRFYVDDYGCELRFGVEEGVPDLFGALMAVFGRHVFVHRQV